MADDPYDIFRKVFGSQTWPGLTTKTDAGGGEQKSTSTTPETPPKQACTKPENTPIKINIRDRLRLLVEPEDYAAIEQLALRFKNPEMALRCIWKILVNNPGRFRSSTFSWIKFSEEIRRRYPQRAPIENDYIKVLILNPLLPKKWKVEADHGNWGINDSTFDMSNYGNELGSSGWDEYFVKLSSLYDRDGNPR